MSAADEIRSPSPAPGRSLDIELSGQEIITVDLDNLDANPEDLLDVLRESQSKGAVWAKLASEYWRKGNLDAAEKLAAGGVDSTCSTYSVCSIHDVWIYSFLDKRGHQGCYTTPRIYTNKHSS